MGVPGRAGGMDLPYRLGRSRSGQGRPVVARPDRPFLQGLPTARRTRPVGGERRARLRSWGRPVRMPGMSVHWLRQLSQRVQSSGWRVGEWFWKFEARLRGVELGPEVRFRGRPCLARAPGSRIVLERGVHLNSSLRSNPLGCSRPATLRTLWAGAEIHMGAGSGLSAAVLCAARSIRIGEGTLIGAEVMILDTDFHVPGPHGSWELAGPEHARAVWVGRNVFIGTRAIVLKGVRIGDGAVIGAGAVVTRDVPPYHIAVGNPVMVRPREDRKVEPRVRERPE